MAKKTKTPAAIPIDSTKHKDSRKNIPTEELRDFVRDEEQKPKTVLYPRDPSLDPQLVWKGKDEQDQQDLAVPAVPIYIQEKIHSQAIIEDFRRTAAKVNEPAADLFSDFNGLANADFATKVDFYSHDARNQPHWSNRLILGDSLLVMNSLAEKEGLKGQVQTIYFDPPYGIKFGSNWQVSTRKREVKDGRAEDATRQPEQVRAFRDTWKLGVHSYLAYLRDRLVLSRELLTESGSVFVQIGDENAHLVRNILDEVFGSQNCCGQIVFVKTSGLAQNLLADRFDLLLWYAKNIDVVKYRQLYFEKSREEGTASNYGWLDLDGSRRGMSRAEKSGEIAIPTSARIYKADNITSQGNPLVQFKYQGKSYTQRWKTTVPGLENLAHANRLHVAENTLQYVRYLTDFPCIPVTKLWTDTATGSFTEDKIYVVQTGTKTIERCLLMTTDPGDLVLDPTCGSGTTAYVAEQWGRRWITTDTSRVALALARTRLMTARFPYYLLADSLEGIKKEAEITGKVPPPHKTDGDIRRGFVYQRVPHVTLKSIANNPDIKEGMTRTQIDEAIAWHAETETLYDKPYEEKGRLRVTGPFTVESLSPHRTISADEKKRVAEVPNSEGFTIKLLAGGGFVNNILDNLRKAGVQNTIKNQRLKFDSLDVFPGQWIAGEGRYTDADGRERRVAVCIGPEHGTVGQMLIAEAAKEAVKGVGFDMLLVCGFAFDPMVNEKARQFGKLDVLMVRMNPDLAMGDELLKKTGAGNLFMVFGEPDLKVTKAKDGKIVVELKGLDVYDPTTGAIRESSTDDIACWFIDTNYNGESFFVRHAYFTGADEPYEKLKNALRAEIDEAAWSELYATTSRPFEKPATGKIAVKVINHYGDEVMKVYTVQ